jgi:hypothetical protein
MAKRLLLSFGTLVAFAFFAAATTPQSGSPSGSGTSATATPTPAKPAISDDECKKTLQCWGEKHDVEASVYCRQPVELLAKNNFEWTDGILEPKFSHYRWKNQQAGVVTYIGDKIKYQNGFGAWIFHVYECDWDPVAKKVVDVRARPGRLGQ